MLFAMVNVTRLLGVDAEQALRRAGRKFEDRFRGMERLLLERDNSSPADLDLDQLEAAWEAVKRAERRDA